ncbi:DUF2292 domain-containing protein [Anaerovorax sp. IOR16]|uniref:DUF2292 domain-containing protein n=1 Tax=Anaerovorax sp. IOR16 TaxID=2773458 RepID=UPI0019D21FEA|nr:DUF2292 domain-containing protein [Anaerovorax sp. IOR16]
MERPLDLTVTQKEEVKLLALIREIKYGELRVIINEGKPIRVEDVRKSIKL